MKIRKNKERKEEFENYVFMVEALFWQIINFLMRFFIVFMVHCQV